MPETNQKRSWEEGKERQKRQTINSVEEDLKINRLTGAR